MSDRISKELLLELGELLNSNLDEITILRTFCNKLLSLFDAERVSILSLDSQGKHLTLTAWAGRYPEDIENVTVPVGDGVAGWVAATGDSLLVPDVDQDHRFSRMFPERYRTRSFLSVPLKSRGRLLGVLNVSDTTRNEGFTESNFGTLKPLALQVGMGMENLRLREDIYNMYTASTSLVSVLQQLTRDISDIESELIPNMIKGLGKVLGPQSHMILIGEMGSNLAWIGKTSFDISPEVGVMDFQSGFSLYQLLTALPLHPPFPQNERLSELGFDWDLISSGKLRLIRNLLPPKHDLFGISLSAVLEKNPDHMDLLRVYQTIITHLGGLLLGGIFDRTQIQRLDQLKTELISTVSHELRTPLTSIQGFSELVLRTDELPDPHSRYLSIINNESKRLNRLINNFLDLARLESREAALVKEPIDSLNVAESAVRLLKPQAEENRAQIHLYCEKNLPMLIADRDRLEQVLVNLIGNAIKYGGSDVQISINLNSSEGNTVFSVTDNGPGIPREEQHLVFNRFYRGMLENEQEEEYESKGTGLGLSLAKEIVEQHGGTISMTSSQNERTTFIFTLPTEGLVSPHRGVIAWHPSEENFIQELNNRLNEGKTVGVLTVHVNPDHSEEEVEEEFSVEVLSEIEELISSILQREGVTDDIIQGRPQGEFIILTYASLLDNCAEQLLRAFSARFGETYSLAIGAAASEGEPAIDGDQLVNLASQACRYVERTLKRGYLKNRRM
ncbi:MAG: ATP-binding protein [bacterium]